MGKPEQNSIGAVIAVLVVGMLLLLVVVGGAAVLLGGLFFARYETAPQAVTVNTAPAMPYPTAGISHQLIEIDEAGNITADGEAQTLEELRAKFEVWARTAGYIAPQLKAHPDCPEEIRADVVAACEELLGSSPEIIEEDVTLPVAPDETISGEPADPVSDE